MKHNNKYIYPKTVRTTIDGKRHYDIDSGKYKLPSVTTILSATQTAEKRESLERWREREELKKQRGSLSNLVQEGQRCTRYLRSGYWVKDTWT